MTTAPRTDTIEEQGNSAARRMIDVRKILILQEWVPQYRVALFEALADELAARGAELTLAHGQPDPATATRGDATTVRGALRRPNRRLRLASRSAVWQSWLDLAGQTDLIVVGEGMRFLLNYLLLARQHLGGGAPVAYWGHGANHVGATRSAPVEHARDLVYRLPRWWFAYTEGGRRRLSGLGFPLDRITVVQNSAATPALTKELDQVGSSEIARLRADLGLEPGPIGLFLGSLYDAKRLDFLVEASDVIAHSLPKFSLLICGDGPDYESVKELSARRPHVHLLGRVDGEKKAAALSAADVLLQPSAMGLSITEAFAAALPVVAIEGSGHRPEIEYLQDGVNGVLIGRASSAAAYAAAVVSLLRAGNQLRAFSIAARESARRYSAENTVAQYVAGLEGFAEAEGRPLPGGS